MNFNPNLGFDEIMYRYATMMAVGITLGVLRLYWAIPVMMIIFMTALMGYCPIKEALVNRKKRMTTKNETASKGSNVIHHTTAHA